MHLDIDGIGGAFMTSLWQLKRFEARISLFKSLDCPLALAAAGMKQRFTRYPPVINHNLGWCNSPRLVKREAGFPNPWRALIGSNQLLRVKDSPYYREFDKSQSPISFDKILISARHVGRFPLIVVSFSESVLVWRRTSLDISIWRQALSEYS